MYKESSHYLICVAMYDLYIQCGAANLRKMFEAQGLLKLNDWPKSNCLARN